MDSISGTLTGLMGVLLQDPPQLRAGLVGKLSDPEMLRVPLGGFNHSLCLDTKIM